MFPWWVWTLLWVGLLGGGAVLLWMRVRRLWREMRATAAEVARTERALTELERSVQREPLPDVQPFVPSIARDRVEVRLETAAALATTRAARTARRRARRPPWARRID